MVALAYASAGYVGTEHSYAAPVAAQYSSAPAVSYSNFIRHSPSLGHGYAHDHHAHAAPVLATSSHGYAAPLTNHFTYGQNLAPALAYDQGYAPALSHDNYGYTGYAAPLATKPVVVAQPQLYHHNTYATHAAPVLAAHDYNHGGDLRYHKHHGHYTY